MAIRQLQVHSLQRPVNVIPLIALRISFGLLMAAGTIRFVAKGWVHEFYIAPPFHFTYTGFGWVKPLPGEWLYAVYAAVGLLSLCIAAGFFYRASMIAFFLLFTYTELLDKTYYLNHYYFVSLLSFLLIFLPLHRCWSVDQWRWSRWKRDTTSLRHLHAITVPRWTVDVVRLQVGLVYFFAGLAKLTPDWLFQAMPLRIWLTAHTSFPLIGTLFDEIWMAYLLSWVSAFYDLTIPFWLLWRKTRLWAYVAVIGFHVMTALLFNIGMFPWIMMACTVVFLDGENFTRPLNWLAAVQEREVFKGIRRILSKPTAGFVPTHLRSISLHPPPVPHRPVLYNRMVASILILFFVYQMGMPLRHWFYPGDVHWTEEGFRFAWKVMVVQKTGYVEFHVRHPESGRQWVVAPGEFLTPIQERQMAFQPDMILQFAHHLAEVYRARGVENLAISAEAYVSLNGRASRLLIDPTVDLTLEENTLEPKPWILKE